MLQTKLITNKICKGKNESIIKYAITEASYKHKNILRENIKQLKDNLIEPQHTHVAKLD